MQSLLPIMSFSIPIIALRYLLRSGTDARLAIDQPNARSLHILPVPRIGGIVLVPVFLITWLLGGNSSLILMLSVLSLAVLSYLDDFAGLPVFVRLAAHFGAAFLCVALMGDFKDVVTAIAAVLCIVWGTNLYNFMDGADGLAGGMALIGFSLYGAAVHVEGNGNITLLCWLVAASAGGFLFFNLHPAKIFMGDAGSIPLGFLMGIIGILGWQSGNWPFWFPFLVFSPFIVDATVTLIKRVFTGERFWQAHREHYYQRLIRMGWTHRRLALSEYGLMTAAGLSAIYMLQLNQSVQFTGLLLWVSIYVSMMKIIDSRWKRHLLEKCPV